LESAQKSESIYVCLKLFLRRFFVQIFTYGCPGFRSWGFCSQGTCKHLTNRFCAFLNTLGCLGISFFLFCDKSLWSLRFLGMGTRRGFRVPRSGTRDGHPYFYPWSPSRIYEKMILIKNSFGWWNAGSEVIKCYFKTERQTTQR
jgi:hypothetical protein